MHIFLMSTLLTLLPYTDIVFQFGNQQVSANSCGAASVSTLQGIYHSKDSDLSAEVISQDRTNLLYLRNFLTANGVECEGYHLTYNALEHETLTKPVLIHLRSGNGHFALAYHVDSIGAVIFDPSRGNVFIGRSRLLKEWDNTSLVFGEVPPLESWTRLQKIAQYEQARHSLLTTISRRLP